MIKEVLFLENMQNLSNFMKKVFEIVSRIPKGCVATYGQIASILGNKNYARAVGNALNKNPSPILIPCHRVIRSDGKIGGFASGVKSKIALLSNEGIEVIDGQINLSKYQVDSDFLPSEVKGF